MTDSELHSYFENFVRTLRSRGVVCAIACVHYGLRPYVLAMGRELASAAAGLVEEHAVRLACAEKHLEKNPVGRYGVERLIEDARQSTAAFVRPELIRWLPDVRPHFRFLTL